MNKNFFLSFPSRPDWLRNNQILPQGGILCLAGMLFIFFIFLGATKISSWTLIEAEGEHLWLYQITIGLELVVGLLFLLRPSTVFPWLSATLLSAGFVLFSFFGPDIKKCHCLGELAEIGPSARLAIALLLLALSTLGTALTLNNPE
jgi:hypothetical protein